MKYIYIRKNFCLQQVYNVRTGWDHTWGNQLSTPHISSSELFKKMVLKVPLFLALLTCITYKSSLKINELNNCHAVLQHKLIWKSLYSSMLGICMLNLLFELSGKSLYSHLYFLYRTLRKTKVSAGLNSQIAQHPWNNTGNNLLRTVRSENTKQV